MVIPIYIELENEPKVNDQHIEETDSENEEVGDLPPQFDPNEYEIMYADELIDKLEALGEGDATLNDEEANEEGFVSEAKSVFSGHTDSVLAVDINKHNYPQVCTGGVDDRAFLFNIEEGTIEENLERERLEQEENAQGTTGADEVQQDAVIEEIKDFKDSIVDVAFSASGKYVAIAAYDGEIKILNTAGKQLKVLNGPSDIEYIQWHNKADILTSGGGDGTIYVWTLPSGSILHVLSGHTDAVTCGAFNHTGNIYITGSIDGSVKVWKIKTGQLLHTFKTDSYNWHEDGIVSLAIHPEAPLMISGARDGTVCLTNLKQYKILMKYTHEKPDVNCSVETVGFSSVNNWVCSGSMDGTIKVYDVELSKLRHTLDHDGGVTKLLWHPFKPFIFSACLDGCIYVWDARNGEKLRQIRAHNDIILDMDIYVPPQDLNITYIVTGSDDHTCQLFKVQL